MRREFEGGVIAPIAQVLRHCGGFHNLSRVHDSRRIERSLDLAEGRIDLLAEQLPVPMAAGQPIAVFPAHRSFKFHDQFLYRGGDRCHGFDLGSLLEVNQRTDMKASYGGMPIESCPGSVPGKDLKKPLDVAAEIFRRNSRVLYKRDRF